MSTKQTEALKLALESMSWTDEWRPEGLKEQAITAIREALAEPPCKTGSQCTSKCQQCEQPAQQQEPVAWRWTESNGQHWFDWRTDWTHHDRAKAMGFAIEYAYTSPPQRKPLTDEEILDMARTFGAQPWPPGSCVAFARAIEAKLKENT